VSLFTYYQSGLRWEDGKDTESFTRVDAQLAYDFSVANSAGRVKLVAQNIGSNYAEFSPQNQFETRLFLVAEITFP